ncbi:MAG: RNA polymerase sigma factor [Bacteroidales bacterium]
MLFKSRLQSLSDKELIDRYKKRGDKEIIGVLFKRYTRFVYAVCLKYLKDTNESEDAVMQIFENLFVDLKNHTVLNFKSWLYTVSKNHSLHIIRGRKKGLPNDDNRLDGHRVFMENDNKLYHDNDDILEQRISELEKEISNLSDEQRICIELFYLKNKSYNEVACESGFTVKQVKSYIQNGKRNLKNSLSGYE